MKRIFLVITLLSAVSFSVCAQEDIDMSRFVAVYQYSCKTTDKDGKAIEDIKNLALQVGTKASRCYSYLDYVRDFGEEEENQTVSEDMLKYATEQYVIMPDVWVDFADGKITTREDIYPNIYEVNTDRPKIDWTLTDDTCTICGYSCMSAEGVFHGKQWKVYYTEEIPSTAGPWKLGGLPGLIVKATDNEQLHEILLTDLKNVASPIQIDKAVPSILKVSEKKMISYRNQVFGNPKYAKDPYYYIPNINSTIQSIDVYKNEDDAIVKLNGHFFMLQEAHDYQPLELK